MGPGMKRIVVLAIVLLAAPAWADDDFFSSSPGALSESHAELDDASDCRALDKSLEGVVVVRKHGATLSESRLSSLFTEKRFATVIESAA